MRVLVLTQGFPRFDGDSHAPFVLDHARALAAAGAEVTVLCPSAPGLPATDRFGDVRVVRFRYAPRRLEVLAYDGAMHRAVRGPRALLVPLLLLGFVVGAARLARTADVLHAHWWAPSGLVAVVVGRLLGVPTAVHVHGTDAAIARGPLRRLARAVLRQAGVVLAASSFLADWVLAVSGVDATVAPMPLDPSRVPPPSPAPVDGPVVAVGRLVPEKGFDVLVRAAARAGVPVTIVGDGDQRAALEGLAASEGADVTFAGRVAPDELARIYAGARAVAVPSRREGFGLVAAEAAAAGRTVLASDVGGLPDSVKPQVNGVLLPVDDVEAWADALRSLDPGLGEGGPGAVAWLRPDAIAARNLAAYDRAAAARRPALVGRLARFAAGLLALLALGLLARAIARQWDEVRGLDVDLRPGPVLGAAAAVLAANILLSWSWGWLVRRLGGDLGWRPALRVFWTGQLGRYLPTGLGSVPARVVLAGREGVARRLVALTTVAEPATIVLTSLATASLLLPGVLGPLGLALGLVAVAAVLAAVVRAPVAAAGYVAMQEAQLLLKVLAVALLLRIVGGDAAFAQVAGGVGLAYFLGFLAVFAPGGIGVREASIAATLGPAAGLGAAAAAALLLRLFELVVEAVLLVWARWLGRRTSAGS